MSDKERIDVRWLTHLLRGDVPQDDRSRKLIGYSARSQQLIQKAIELDPALEETILAIAESTYQDGCEAGE